MRHIENYFSDHSMILLDTKYDLPKCNKRFSFDKRWIRKEGVEEVIHEVWKCECYGTPMFKVASKIKKYRMALLKWNKQQMSNSAIRISQLKKELDALRDKKGQRDWEQWHVLKSQLDSVYTGEEMYWSQKASNQLLKKGDKNTKFFHASVVQRQKSNRTEMLEKEQGGICENDEELVEEVASFYENLFTSEDGLGWKDKLDGILSTITETMNLRLIRPLENSEIKKALFSMNPNKAPGLDSMTLYFSKSFGILFIKMFVMLLKVSSYLVIF